MMLAESNNKTAFDRVTITGFKSFANPVTLNLSPLTIISGANSSGKSSSIQPLLLIKQTLEAPFDPGPLLLDGPNVRVTSADQIVSKLRSRQNQRLTITFHKGNNSLKIRLRRLREVGFEIENYVVSPDGKTSIQFSEGACRHPIDHYFPRMPQYLDKQFINFLKKQKARVVRDRCKYEFEVGREKRFAGFRMSPYEDTFQSIRNLIHVPGLRGHPERLYRTVGFPDDCPGVFTDYVATFVRNWQDTNDHKLDILQQYLRRLGLANSIQVSRRQDTVVELKVSSYPAESAPPVNIADVGFGVSQCLAVLVALILAKKDQMIFIEQPELHLHPKAQYALAEIIADTSARGVRVIFETHSLIMLRRIQTLVAKGKLNPSSVNLAWFSRKTDGATSISQSEFGEDGSIEDIPVDFADIALMADREFLMASLAK